MTEKRFRLDTGCVIDMQENKVLTDRQATNRLNELHEENEHYKSRLEYLERKIQRERKASTKQHLKWSKEAEEQIQILAEENEQLKQTNQKLYDNLQETIGHLALKSGIEKENEQLNKSRDELISENRHIKKTIQTMLINERTAIGKSVLKQLWNAIHME